MSFMGLLDMFDGGGAGASGSQFKGGPFSGIANAIGIKPNGYRDRMEGMANTRPQMRPGGMGGVPNMGSRGPMEKPQGRPGQMPNYGPPGMGQPQGQPQGQQQGMPMGPRASGLPGGAVGGPGQGQGQPQGRPGPNPAALTAAQNLEPHQMEMLRTALQLMQQGQPMPQPQQQQQFYGGRGPMAPRF